MPQVDVADTIKSNLCYSFKRQLLDVIVYEFKKKGICQSLCSLVRIARGIPFVKGHNELFSLPLVNRFMASKDDANLLFYLRHENYLCRGFNLKARINSALSHYRFEEQNHSKEYKDSVYSGRGLVLWSCLLNGSKYEIRLRERSECRHEGGTSILIIANKTLLAETSYAWVDAESIKVGKGVIPFITRHQTMTRRDSPELKLFRINFPQHSPKYFCFAAMQGIASAHCQSKLAAIKHDRQISFSEQYAEGFRRSYCEFWESFGGLDVSDDVYLISVPPDLPTLEKISSKHRKRAAARRAQWASITESTIASLRPHIVAASKVLAVIITSFNNFVEIGQIMDLFEFDCFAYLKVFTQVSDLIL